MYAYCLIEYPVKTLDKAFTYKIPLDLQNKLKIGMKVLVPFNTRLVHGIVLNITNDYQDKYELKEIARIEDEFLILNKELLELGKYLKEKTLCNLITAYQTMLPSALKIKNQKSNYNKYEDYVELQANLKVIYEYIDSHKGKKVEVLERLLEEKQVLKKEFDANSIRELLKLDLIKIKQVQVYRINKDKEEIQDINLNLDQLKVFNKVKDSLEENKTFLLYGVTGSGKTLVYINLIKEVLKLGKTAIMLVPEISLTEQVINIFYQYFGKDVAILHSGLSKGEKYDEYLKIINKEVKIAIGTRSAIFAPLENLGIIIIDEEHSETYKQDNNPRYQAKDIAQKRCEYYGIPLVLGSATPSLEAMARAQKGVYTLLTLEKRVNNQALPTCMLVDMKKELAKRNFVISEALDKELKDVLNKNEQAILLLNRRGYSTVITCSNCGFTYKCPHCEVTLTYHKSSNTLRCHICGYTKIKDDICPKCREKSLNYLGLGTEKLENLINTKYPLARVIRMDADTTATKGAHNKLIKAFRNHEYDILIGTQMISKGLDFPNCTLVGIINADATLNIPDFRSSERTFALIHQASGRAGRANLPGKVIIQTYNPDNNTLKMVAKNDYLGFYKLEMPIRKVLKYPPYYYLVSIKVCSKKYDQASINAKKVLEYLKKNLAKTSIILGPSTALNFRMNDIYRFSITIKYQFDDYLKETLQTLDEIFGTNKDTFLEIDLNPMQL